MTIDIFGAPRFETSEWAVPPATPPARTLLDVFAATVSAHPRRPALDAAGTTLTYAELAAAAEALAERLRDLGAGAGDRVGIRVPSGTTELYVAILGVLAAGAAYVPVDHDDPPARAEEIWRDAGACAVVGEGLEITELLPATGDVRPPSPDDDAWIIFTSGSTGRPKGVAVTHRSAAAFVDAEERLWTVEPRDRVLAGLSVGFDASCEEMWLAWRNGAALVPAPRSVVRSGGDLGPWLAARGVTVVSTVPTLAAMWDEDVIASVRLLILGGEACPAELGWRLARDREVWNTYGPTEATVVSTAARIRPGEPVTIGGPLDGWEVAVVDELGDPVPFGDAGELVIGGAGLGRYLDPVLDEERFAPVAALDSERAYRTGDIVREAVLGLEFVGRRDDQVKVGGRRIELGEVDAQLSAVPGVRAAATAVRRTAGGNSVLVGYVTGDVDPADVRAHAAERLPDGMLPVVVVLDELPARSSGKVDRAALPWPPPDAARTGGAGLTGTAAWLAERWADQLGPLPIGLDTDFFALGGSSLAAAKLVSRLRERFPAVAVADVYHHRTLRELAARLDDLAPAQERVRPRDTRGRRLWGAVQLVNVVALLAITAPGWIIGILAFDDVFGGSPQVAWPWLLVAWALLLSVPGRLGIVLGARRLLLGRLKPGRYPRHGWLACRLLFVDRLIDLGHLDNLAGTPWAPRYARLMGARVGRDARLGTLPPPTAIVTIGEGATLEGDVDLGGWWIEGDELVIGEIRVGARARVGTRSALMPGADVGEGAELEPGSVVSGPVPAGERWAGSPASRVGVAGEHWPVGPAPAAQLGRLWKLPYALGLLGLNVLPLISALPALGVLELAGADLTSLHAALIASIVYAPALAVTFVISEAVLVALVSRATSRLLRPGWHHDYSRVSWALWFGGSVMSSGSDLLFPLYASLFVRSWLRLAGIKVGRRTEVSTSVGLNPLVSLGETSFQADDVMYVTARARDGWLRLAPIEVGDRTFLGNGAILTDGTKIGDDCLVGVMTTPAREVPDGTSWFGSPPLELPRVPDRPDPSRTTNPPRRLVAARAAMELARIVIPASASVVLGAGVMLALAAIGGGSGGLLAMALLTPLVLLGAGVCATAFTVAAKWLLMGRYRRGEHPLWSFFVWRDELMNSLVEFAGGWLLMAALGSPLMPMFLRAMGAKVGRDVWCETPAITEFDLVTIDDGAVVNRFTCLETHLFHDRLMRLGPTHLGAGSTLGPLSVVLPDTALGAGTVVGARSVVMRGEELPAGTRWHGAPVAGA